MTPTTTPPRRWRRAIDKYTATAIVNAGALGARRARCGRRGMGRGRVGHHRPRRGRGRPAAGGGAGGQAAIVRHDDDTYWRGYRHGGSKVPPDWEDVRATITPSAPPSPRTRRGRSRRRSRALDAPSSSRTRSVTGSARDSGCGGQTVEAGTARLYADAAKRIDDRSLAARPAPRPTRRDRSAGSPSTCADSPPKSSRRGWPMVRILPGRDTVTIAHAPAGGAVLAPDPPDRDPTLPIPQRT